MGVCTCTLLSGKRRSECDAYDKCTRDLIDSTPKPDTEALFKKFIDEFPVLSALDVFCNPCGRPRAISYRKDPDGNAAVFYAVFSCNCDSYGIGHHSAEPAMTREQVLEIIRGE